MSTRTDIVVSRSNEGFAAGLEPRKLYVVIEDAAAREKGLVRGSTRPAGTPLYSADVFVPIEPAEAARRALQLAC